LKNLDFNDLKSRDTRKKDKGRTKTIALQKLPESKQLRQAYGNVPNRIIKMEKTDE